MAAQIHSVRQAKADLERDIHALKSEARKLLETPRANRVPAQEARLNAIDVELAARADELGTTLTDLARLERVQEDERASAGGGAPVPTVVRARGRKFAEMFPHVPLSMGGFKSTEEFLATLHSGLADPRLTPTYTPGMRATSTGNVPSEGGFSVPTQMWADWLDTALENEIVRSRCDLRPMTSSSAVAAGWDSGDHTSELYGGFTGEWLDEAGGMTAQTPNMRLIQLKARKLGILTAASNELIADGVGFEEQLTSAMPKACGWFLDRAFFMGNGASQPLGIFNSPVTITIAKEAGQTAATILYVNLAKMLARLHPGSFANSVWVANPTTIPQLLQMSISVGTAGSFIPVLSESGGKYTLLTRPVVFTEKVPVLGTVGDIGLYDFTQYVVGLRADFSLAKSAHVGFTSDLSYYRGIIRVDGQPKLTAPIVPYKGDTLSPFVLLASRP
jgi:HK97 family phage major capsid protein